MQTNALRPVLLALGALSILTQMGCEPGGPLMAPGEDCLSCHKHFTVAGTVFSGAGDATDGGLAGVVITITDATGAEVQLTSNDAGNFYTSAKMALPLARATVTRDGRVTAMSGAPSGACNGCHTAPPDGGAPGRLYAP
jgi:hypothetical protein